MTRLNYAITLYRNGECEEAKGQLQSCEDMISDEQEKNGSFEVDPEAPGQIAALRTALDVE